MEDNQVLSFCLEIYDDKVKEGADLVAKLLGSDFSKPFSPQRLVDQ